MVAIKCQLQSLLGAASQVRSTSLLRQTEMSPEQRGDFASPEFCASIGVTENSTLFIGKTFKMKYIPALAVFALLAACSSVPQFQTGPDAEITHDGLTRVDRTIMDAVWARTDVDLRGANKVRFHDLGVEYRNVSGPYSGRAGRGTIRAPSSATEFQLDAATRALFEEEIRGALVEEISKSTVFELTEESGPDVIDVHIGLLDVVSRVPPETVSSTRILIDSVGEATLVLELRDSVSHTVLVRAVDRRAAESSTMFQSTPSRNRAEVRRLGRRWGQLIRDGLEAMIADGMRTE